MATRTHDGRILPKGFYVRQQKGGESYSFRDPSTGQKHPVVAVDLDTAINQVNEAISALAKVDGDKVHPILKSAAMHSLLMAAQEFKTEEELNDPSLASKGNWKQRISAIHQMADSFGNRASGSIARSELVAYWKTLTVHQQKNNRTWFGRFIVWTVNNGQTPTLTSNPFLAAVAGGERYKPVVPKRRKRMTLDQFWLIHDKAGEMGLGFVQDAMMLCMATTMRRADIVRVAFSDVIDDSLQVVIHKSEEMHGEGHGARLRWDLDKHPLIKQIVNTSRESALSHFNCPSVIKHKYGRPVEGEAKAHRYSVTPDFLSKMLAKARDSIKEFQDMDSGTRPTFHEVRALSSHLLKHKAGYSEREIGVLMAHTDPADTLKMTNYYTDYGHGVWTDIDVVFPTELLERAA